MTAISIASTGATPATSRAAHRQPPSGNAPSQVRSGKLQQPERNHDAERDKAVEQALRQRHRHQIHEAVDEIHHQRTSSSLSSADWKRLTSDSTVSPVFSSPPASNTIAPSSIITRRFPWSIA